MTSVAGRVPRPDPILIQAVIAAALSFAHIHDVADACGQGGWKAWAYPISVDVLLAVAWRRMRTTGGAAAWSWFLVAMAASLGANIATSGVMDLSDPPAWLRVLVAGWPAVAFLGGTLLVHGTEVTAENADAERESPAQEPLTAFDEPAEDEEAPEPHNPEIAPEPPAQPPVLVTYDAAAQELGVSPATVRGWAHTGYVRRHPGPTVGTVRVDLVECTQHHNRRAVGA